MRVVGERLLCESQEIETTSVVGALGFSPDFPLSRSSSVKFFDLWAEEAYGGEEAK